MKSKTQAEKPAPKKRASSIAVEDLPFIVHHSFPETERARMQRSGVPINALMDSGSWDVRDFVQMIKTAEIPNVQSRLLGVKKQVDMWKKLWDKPIGRNVRPLVIISSFPADSRAKQLGVLLFMRMQALYAHLRSANTPEATAIIGSRHTPLWHSVYGGYADAFPRDANPSAVFISNCLDDSSAQKFEKVRDIIEQYQDVPRIIITAATDPLTFSLSWLKASPDVVIYIGPQDAVKQL